MKKYSVQQLAKMAGVSVRTLHLYDQKKLLSPAMRTDAGYRLYGEAELLRLQQILFYKTLDFPLEAIRKLLDKPDFNMIRTLEQHRTALQNRQSQIEAMLATIDKTVHFLKEKNRMTHEALYEGFPKDKAETYRREAIEKYGNEAIEQSENSLKNMGKAGFEALKSEQQAITLKLLALMYDDPASEKVQAAVARHYEIIRQFWGTDGSPDKQAEAYAGLGQLYVSDERFTMVDGKPNPEFAQFLSKAMGIFSESL